MRSLPIKSCIVFAVLFLAGSAQTSPPARQDLSVRELVAREATVELGAWQTFLREIRPEQIRLRPLESTTPGVQLWEARPPVDHWHRYVVAQRGNVLWRLGGFAENDLAEFYNTLQGETGRVRKDQPGQYLVGVADPYGGELIYPTARTGRVAREWLARRSPNWPADTVQVNTDGSSVHRLTVLSKFEHSYDQPWVPMVFTFDFDREGLLRTWHRREGARFHVVSRPVSP